MISKTILALGTLAILASTTALADPPTGTDPATYIPYGSTLTVAGQINIPPRAIFVSLPKVRTAEGSELACSLLVEPEATFRQYKLGTTFSISDVNDWPEAMGAYANFMTGPGTSAVEVRCCALDPDRGGNCIGREPSDKRQWTIDQFTAAMSSALELEVAPATVIEN